MASSLPKTAPIDYYFFRAFLPYKLMCVLDFFDLLIFCLLKKKPTVMPTVKIFMPRVTSTFIFNNFLWFKTNVLICHQHLNKLHTLLWSYSLNISFKFLISATVTFIFPFISRLLLLYSFDLLIHLYTLCSFLTTNC